MIDINKNQSPLDLDQILADLEKNTQYLRGLSYRTQRNQKFIEGSFVALVFSWMLTVPDIIFSLIPPVHFTLVLFLFPFITITLHLIRFSTKREIKLLQNDYEAALAVQYNLHDMRDSRQREVNLDYILSEAKKIETSI
ncbi:hypothetical protein ACFX4N_24065 [Priestia sp. YIM B13551]|uniref:hypothetical protein n=1 Tax=Priestia sp. YIM B13551 TaxID=3366306 RepID=UPI003672CE0D